MKKILVPFINSNETEAKLVDWNIEDKSKVSKGDIIASIETTKADVDLECEYDGNIKIIGKPGENYAFGEIIAFIYEDELEIKNFEKKYKKTKKTKKKSIITKPARKFMEENNILEEDILSLGLEVIKTKDIKHLANKNENEFDIKISPRQLAIAKTVEISKFSIPDAYQLKKIYVDNAIERLSAYSKKHKLVLGIPELLIYVISSLHNKYPFFYGKIKENDVYEKTENPNIGITLDVGKGLFIPVIFNANKLKIKDIAVLLTSYKLKSIRNSFKNEELSNSNITISLNMDDDTFFVKPIIFPDQTCMISLNAIFKEVVLNDGKINEVKYLNLGLSYDHRVINGFEANSFLTDIKKIIEGDFKLN
tara:strand:+ start:21062 stop:22156 length:1095 start_codon:yes stop_codon:yes gene_type:complete